MFKIKRSYLAIAALLLMAIMIPLGLKAQSREIPPPPPMPTSSTTGEERSTDGKKPTATPDPEEAKKLPYEYPPEEPEREVIDTAPELERLQKYAILIQRGKSDKKVVIFVPWETKSEEILAKYLHPDEGDTYYLDNTPPIGPALPDSKVNN